MSIENCLIIYSWNNCFSFTETVIELFEWKSHFHWSAIAHLDEKSRSSKKRNVLRWTVADSTKEKFSLAFQLELSSTAVSHYYPAETQR